MENDEKAARHAARVADIQAVSAAADARRLELEASRGATAADLFRSMDQRTQ